MFSAAVAYPTFEGNDDGPTRADFYKRAIQRPAPSSFSVQMLQPTKMSGGHVYGMRIYPIARDDRSSMSSISSLAEYDIWRRWEDCLAFQGTLEEEYRRMARAKRLRLQRGKGIKRNGFYKQDAASSWESLPPGPDPNSVGRDLHDYVPALTKKGTVFRASQATIDQRAAELAAFVQALWAENVPALVSEMRDDRVVTDFFAYWRRDHDITEKQRKQRLENSKSRNSVTSSIFSMYFSPSNTSSQDLSRYPESITTSHTTYRSCRHVSPSPVAPRNRKASTSSSDGSPLPNGRRRAPSTGSSNFSPSTPSDSSFDSPVLANVAIPAVADDLPTITFDHDPVQWQSTYIQERLPCALVDLPEGREVCLKTEAPLNPPPVSRRQRKSSAGDVNPDRHGRIFLSPPPATDVPLATEESSAIPNRSLRESWQTVDSACGILEGMNFTLPAERSSHRASMSSIATFMTDVSIDGVLPRAQNSHQLSPLSPLTPLSGTFTPRSRVVSAPISVSEYDDNWSDPEDDLLDTFLAESFPIPSFDIPHMEVPHVLVAPSITSSCPSTPLSSNYPNDVHSTSPSHVPTSPAKSATFSISTTMTAIPDTITIKAKYNDSLIVLRVSDDISYKDLRQRLLSKFVGQEGIPLSDSFKITFMQPLSKSVLSDHSHRCAVSATTGKVAYPITSQGDWENVAACIEGHKLALIISDSSA